MRPFRFLFILFFLTCYASKSQNLVPNPSFEEYNPCNPSIECTASMISNTPCKSSCCAAILPQNHGQMNSFTYNWWAVSLYLPPAYINECTIESLKQELAYEHQHSDFLWYTPRTGNAFILFSTFGYAGDGGNPDTTNFRQYAQVKLTHPLQRGCTYEASNYTLLLRKLDHFSYFGDDLTKQIAADGLGMYLSTDSLYMNDYHQEFQAMTYVTPQVSNPSGHLLSDSLHYEKVSGTYKAQGGEQWLVIGNFKDNDHTQVAGNKRTSRSIYSIDDVSVQVWRPDLISVVDTTICADSSITLTMPAGLSHYLWSTGDTTQQLTLRTAGNYTVQASNGCEVLHDQFTIHSKPRYTQPFTIGPDTFFCKVPVTFPLTAPSGFNTYHWSNGTALDHTTVDAPGQYKVTAIYECGTLSDSMLITEFVIPDTLLIPATDTTLCSNQSLDIQVYRQANYSIFHWSDSSTTDHLLIHYPATYRLKAITPKGCEVNDSIHIIMIYPPSIPSFPDTSACEGTSFSLVLHPASSEQVRWYDGQAITQHDFIRSNTYWVDLFNRCYTASDTFAVDFVDCSLNIPNLITLNGDGMNDFFTIQSKIKHTLSISIYNAWGNEVYKADDYKNEWGGSDIKDGIYFYQVTDALLNKNYKGWVQVVK